MIANLTIHILEVTVGEHYSADVPLDDILKEVRVS